jgi:hypothetical protein
LRLAAEFAFVAVDGHDVAPVRVVVLGECRRPETGSPAVDRIAENPGHGIYRHSSPAGGLIPKPSISGESAPVVMDVLGE